MKTIIYFGLMSIIAFLIYEAKNHRPPLDRLPAEALEKRIHLISTTDLHGYILPQKFKSGLSYGGIDWMSGYFSLAKAFDPETLILDSGDLFQGTFISNIKKGAPVIKFYNYAGYTASVIGNHEFDFGPAGTAVVSLNPGDDPQGSLKEREKQAHFPFLSANICSIDEDPKQCGDQEHYQPASFTQPYLIKNTNGIKVGIVGLTTTDTPETTLATNVAHLRFIPATAALNHFIPKMKAEGAEIIVVIAHIGGFCLKDVCRPSDELFKMIDTLSPEIRKEIPLILAGHTHNFVNLNYHGVHVMINGHYGQAFGYLTLTLHQKDGSVTVEEAQKIDFCHEVYPDTKECQQGNGTPISPVFLGKNVSSDPHAAQLIQKEEADNQALMSVAVGTVNSPLTKGLPESSMGDFMTDALRFCYLNASCTQRADIALQNNGGIRSEISAPGTVTYGQIFQVMPFDDFVATLEMKGAQIHGMLDALAAGSGIPQVSGIHIELNTQLPAPSRTFNNDLTQSKNYPDVIKQITLSDGSYFDESRIYSVVMEDFLATGGGTEFFTHALKNPPQIHYNRKVRDVLVEYLKSHSNGVDYSQEAPRIYE